MLVYIEYKIKKKRDGFMDKKSLKKMWENWLLDIEKNTTQIAVARNDTQQNLSRKINGATIKYIELSEIVEEYGYSIEIHKNV